MKKQVEVYLTKKSNEVIKGNGDYNLYCIPYQEAKNVRSYLSKKEIKIKGRYTHDYKEFIVTY